MICWEPNIAIGTENRAMNKTDNIFPCAIDILGTEVNSALGNPQQQKKFQIL